MACGRHTDRVRIRSDPQTSCYLYDRLQCTRLRVLDGHDTVHEYVSLGRNPGHTRRKVLLAETSAHTISGEGGVVSDLKRDIRP